MIDFRWQVASGGNSHPFEPAAVRRIFEHSQGIPRDANILADNALLLAYLRKRKRITRKLVDAAAKERRETIGADKEKR
jgi:general secretion pathway protein A